MTETALQISEFRDEGYFILESVIPDSVLDMLREECAAFIARKEAEMEAASTDVMGINHRGKRYFISRQFKQSERLHEFLFGQLMADICSATLGDTAYLFWEQFVVKCAEVGMDFSWHQDSGYLGYDHTPYLSCWCALDDVDEENGTVYVLPFSRAGTRERQRAHRPGRQQRQGRLLRRRRRRSGGGACGQHCRLLQRQLPPQPRQHDAGHEAGLPGAVLC